MKENYKLYISMVTSLLANRGTSKGSENASTKDISIEKSLTIIMALRDWKTGGMKSFRKFKQEIETCLEGYE